MMEGWESGRLRVHMMGLCLIGNGDTVRQIDIEAKNVFNPPLVQSVSTLFFGLGFLVWYDSLYY